MRTVQVILILLGLLLGGAGSAPAVDKSPPVAAHFEIAAIDPGAGVTLGAGDRLYLRLTYDSPVPVRFLPEGYRQGVLQENDATSSAPPYDSGEGEALVWILYNSPVRIDEVQVTAYDIEWKKLDTVSTRTVTTWVLQDSYEAREPAAWVGPLLKHHRRVFDTAYDPQPERPRPLFDAFFILSFISIPGYLLMQAQMLARYRGRWQWYASAPLLPIIPLGLYSLFGLGLSTALWVIFLFRYMAVALLYLLILWMVVWSRERKHRRSAVPAVDAAAGTE